MILGPDGIPIHGARRIILGRHAKSVANEAGDYFFPIDYPEENREVIDKEDHEIPLCPKGEKEAVQIGLFLYDTFGFFDAVFDSGYVRTMQTIRVALGAIYPEWYLDRVFASIDRQDRGSVYFAKHGIAKITVSSIAPMVRMLLRERDGGILRLVEKELREKIPWWNVLRKTFENSPFIAPPVGGISLANETTRAILLKFIIDRFYPGKTVYLQTHGNFMRVYKCANLGLSMSGAEDEIKYVWVPNCAVHEYTDTGDKLEFREYLPLGNKNEQRLATD